MKADEILQRVIQELEEREQTHGDKRKVFEDIAGLWANYLIAVNTDIADNLMLDAQDVAAMMALFKIVRIAHNKGNLDSWVDLAGYAACGAELGDKLGGVSNE